jgi:hypothetical protein
VKIINALSYSNQETKFVTRRSGTVCVYKHTGRLWRLTLQLQLLHRSFRVRTATASSSEAAIGAERCARPWRTWWWSRTRSRTARRRRGSSRDDEQVGKLRLGGPGCEEKGAGVARADQWRCQRQRHWQAGAERHREEQLQVSWS